MADDWCEGAIRIPSDHDGGSLLGGPPRLTWHTYEAGYSLGAVAGARALIAAGHEAHFILHPTTGDLVQILPASVAARTLKNRTGGVHTNRMGSAHLQVEVIARASRPWTADLTDAGRRGLGLLVEFARSRGIPDVWPAGPPPAYPSGSSPRSVTTWTGRAGHYGHSQVPENDHGDPGAIDIDVILSAGRPALSLTQGACCMHIVRTPSNGDYLVTCCGVEEIDRGLADRLRAQGMPMMCLRAADTTALSAVIARARA